ncbi:hypothetical protein [Sphingobacterium mizutaii]|uniref:hypothetical protein n=1 Tax=Sphingobacterium mizutaii TaxID=1010 RepID=UPI00289DC36C|nr:hypothetical protein [Sphingobacterium mizutaii]
MFSLIILFVFTGTYFFYCSSKKMKNIHLVENSIFKSLSPKQLKGLGLILLLAAACLTLVKQGIEAGSFAFIVYLMAFLSLINLLFPYKAFQWKHILFLFSISLILEFITQ